MLSCFSYVWLCNFMRCSPPCSSVHGTFQARSGLPFPSPGNLPDSRIKPVFLTSPDIHRQVGSLPPVPPGKPEVYKNVKLELKHIPKKHLNRLLKILYCHDLFTKYFNLHWSPLHAKEKKALANNIRRLILEYLIYSFYNYPPSLSKFKRLKTEEKRISKTLS